MNLQTASYAELDTYRKTIEARYRGLAFEDRKNERVLAQMRECEAELYRIAAALDKAARGGAG